MAASTGSYLDFLNLLLTLGSNIGPAIALIKTLVSQFDAAFKTLAAIAALLKPAAPSTPPVTLPATPPVVAPVALAVSEAEIAAEQKLVALGLQHGMHASKIGDGSLLRGAWQFLQQHPEILTLLLGLLKSTIPAAG